MKGKMKKTVPLVLVIFLLSVNLFAAGEEGGKTMRVGMTQDLDSTSPFISWLVSGAELFSLIYDPLVSFNNDLKPVPHLAKEWSLSDDQLSWTFSLRDDVAFHDGQPLTSADVKFTLEAFVESELGMYASLLSGIESIECPDDYTVVIYTSEPKANMLMAGTPIVPEHIWKDVPFDELEIWENESPVGSGPFQFVEYKQKQYLKMKANDNYFRGRPLIDEVVWVFYANNDTMAQALRLGEIDAASNLSAQQKRSLEADENIHVISAVIKGFTEIGFNCWDDPESGGNPLLLDKRIRQAIDWAVDKQTIIDVAYAGEGIAGSTLIDPGDYYHYVPSAAELRSFNIDKAKQILDDAGYRDRNGDGIREDGEGNKLEFTFSLISDNTEEVKAGQMIAGMVKEAGIRLNVEVIDESVLLDKTIAGEHDLFIWGWGADLDPTTILAVMSTSEIGNMSDCFYSNPVYDELLEKQQTLMDEIERKAVVDEMQRILYEDVPYSIITYDVTLQAVRTDRWTGWKQVPQDGPFFFGMTNYNYLNVGPVETVAGAPADGGSGGSATMIVVVVLAVLAAAVLIIVRKKRKDAEDD